MNLSVEDKQYILKEHLRHISCISNKEYQRRVWIQGEGLEIDDFDETCCYFFDMGDPVLEKHEEYGISNPQYAILKKFRDQFRIFSDSNNHPQVFINTPAWTEITEMAKQVLEAFNYNKAQE